MGKLMYSIVGLWQMGLLILSLVPYLEGSTIGVSNGGRWGSWESSRWCPSGFYANGFSLRVETPQGGGDDTALNGIRLQCKHKYYPGITAVVESSGFWGDWTRWMYCSSGKVDAFRLRVEPPQGNGDDTAANNMAVHCSNGETLYGDGLSWGSWGSWSAKCPKGVCGFRVKMERPQGSDDDTALNDVQMLCC